MTSSHRRAYVDWARGIAVLLMIEAHTVDAWTRLDVRHTKAFRDATVLGGFAAPLFLWLAGLAVVLAATRAAERTGSRRAAAEMICRRGLEIFILGFLFRLQGFVITPGSHPVTLFRVDILNIMGPAIAVAGIVWFAGAEHDGARERLRGDRDGAGDGDADRPGGADGGRVADLASVVRAAVRGVHDLHAASVGRLRVRGRGGGRADRRGAKRPRGAAVARDPRRESAWRWCFSASTPPAVLRSTVPRRSGRARRPGLRSGSGS